MDDTKAFPILTEWVMQGRTEPDEGKGEGTKMRVKGRETKGERREREKVR